MVAIQVNNANAKIDSLQNVTQILKTYTELGADAQGELFSILYGDLKKIAIGQMSREQAGHTLQATALVHETFIKLMDLESCTWENRRHFFVSASEVMRRILIDHAKSKKRVKRGGNLKRVIVSDLDATVERSGEEHGEKESWLALDRALQEFETLSPVKAEVVKLRFFARMTYEQIADVLGISKSTAERHWVFSKAWLSRQIKAAE